MCVSLFFSTLVCFYYHSLVLDQNKLWQKQALYKFQLQNLLHCLPRITRHLNLQKPIHGNTHTHTHKYSFLSHSPEHPSLFSHFQLLSFILFFTLSRCFSTSRNTHPSSSSPLRSPQLKHQQMATTTPHTLTQHKSKPPEIKSKENHLQSAKQTENYSP